METKANGITFNVALDGPAGAPWLVFSNSLATNVSLWDAQVAALRERYRILRYDHRGHGRTEAPAGRYTFDVLIADAIALLDAFSIERAHFVGISMGGMTALGLAERHPERLRSIVPCDCGPASSPAAAQQWEERIVVARDEGMQALVQPTLARWFPAETLAANADLAAKVGEMIRTTPSAGFAGCAAALTDFDFRPGLGAIGIPVQVMCGTSDAALGGARQIAASIPGAKLVELEGAGHLANLDASDAFTGALSAFLETL